MLTLQFLTNSICAGEPIDLEFDFNSNGVAPFTINYNANGPQAEGPVNNSGQYSFSVNRQILQQLIQ